MIPYGRQTCVVGAVGASAVVVALDGIAAPIAVHLAPAATNDMKVETSITPRAFEDPGNAVWIDEAVTTSSAKKRVVITAPVSALRFTRTAGTGTNNQYEVRA